MKEYEIMQLIEEDVDKYINAYINQYERAYSPKSTLEARAKEIKQLFITHVKQSFNNK